MLCPKCHNDNLKVLDSRPQKTIIRRRRQCTVCEFKFSTIEEIQILDLYVEKRNGTIELFNDQKLKKGIRKAFNKRRINEEKIAILTRKVTEEILNLDKNPIKSVRIGRIVLRNLHLIDEAAYICYWAMFGNFESYKDFSKLLGQFSKDGDYTVEEIETQG